MNDSMNVAGEAINEPSSKVVRTRSRFPSLSYHLYNTERFGEYSPNFVMDCVEGDRVPVRSGGRVQSYSLKAPLLQSISKHKDFYMVPLEAILPINWQKFYTNPVIGDDVPDDSGLSVSEFWSRIRTTFSLMLSGVNTLFTDPNSTAVQLLNAVFRCAVFGEYFYSQGSLIHSLGCCGSRYLRFVYNESGSPKAELSYDKWFDLLMAAVQNVDYFDFVSDNQSMSVVLNPAFDYLKYSKHVVPLRSFLQYLREDLTTYVSFCSVSGATVSGALSIFFSSADYTPQFSNDNTTPYDLRRLWAYQIVCSHFYSNDHIDYIYSADLLRSLIDQCVNMTANNVYQCAYFSVNGVRYQYDGMCSHSFNRVLGSNLNNHISDCLLVTNGTSAADNFYRNIIGYFSILLSYRRSLRFVDYFTGSRSRPLAVGDVNIPVDVNNQVASVVDVSKKIQVQRFLNAVNRFGRKFEEYIKGLSGVNPKPDYHNPLYIGHTSDTVYGIEVENTGAAQVSISQSVTSRLMSNGDRYQFEFEVDRPCVVIGLSYYDIPRAYVYACERPLLHVNRFDMFNPFMQFIGDQDVKFAELGEHRLSTYGNTFGYQLRHMEYKQRYNQAAGGFAENLPGYLFKDSDFGAANYGVITPDFIRSFNAELDDFYISLSGYSLGSYFHFIVDNDNVCNASRPMAFAPSIL